MNNNMCFSNAVCTMASCKMSGECARYQDYLAKTERGEQCLYMLNVSCLKPDANGCQYGVRRVQHRMAVGFRKLYDSMPRAKAKGFYFCATFPSVTAFYKFLNGKKPMDAELQQKMLDAFASCGVDVSVGFDKYINIDVNEPF